MTDQVVFLGCFYPPEELGAIRSHTRGGLQNAANLLQWDYINGIERNLGCSIRVMTRMSLGIYPVHYSRLFIKTHEFERENGAKGTAIGFWNTLPVRPLFFNRVGVHHVLKWASEVNGVGTIFAYSYAMAPVITVLKKRYPNIKVVLILPDLPRYTDMAKSESSIYRIRHAVDEKALKRCLQYVDLLVPITKQMGQLIDPDDTVKKVVIDGMVSSYEVVNKKREESDTFTIAYTGTLTRAYGILDLLAAINEISDPKLRLVICGKGEAEPEVIEMAARDQRIQYRGMVSAEEAHIVQRKADLLINPRKNDSDYTKYSFPSKLLQYMGAGTPVLCYKLTGIGDEYDDYLLYVRDGERLSDAVLRVISMGKENLGRIGDKALGFIRDQKSIEKQTRNMLDIIKVD